MRSWPSRCRSRTKISPRSRQGGVVTYRAFADEYRIWQGADMDLRRLLDAAHERARQRSLTDILSGMEPPPPVVAARHSVQNHVLRVFARRFVGGGEPVEPLDPFSPYDGEGAAPCRRGHSVLAAPRSRGEARHRGVAAERDGTGPRRAGGGGRYSGARRSGGRS